MSTERAERPHYWLGWINLLRPIIISVFFADILAPERPWNKPQP
jgi:hypothetical protein